MKRLLLLSFSSIILLDSWAQLSTWYMGDPAALALVHLNGPNVVLSNAFSQTIEAQQVGMFSDSTSSIGLDSGLVISTGVIYGLLGPNNIPNMTLGGGFAMTDWDIMTMSVLTPGSIYDPGMIQMDLVPEGDTLEVRYVFGSEEYDEYACSDKDDRFGLFLSGPGIVGPFSNGGINMATLPASGLPVTVNTLNRGINGSEGNLALCGMNPGWLADTIYYINNDFGLGTQLDGYTVVLTARAVVVPGETYHLKIVIADVNDGNFDSAVFLPEGAIRCTELSTRIPHSGEMSTPMFWLDDERTVHMRGLLPDGGPAHVEVFDVTGRLLQRAMATSAERCSARLPDAASGMVLFRASQMGRVMTGKVFVR
jgi:hypothetical protein